MQNRYSARTPLYSKQTTDVSQAPDMLKHVDPQINYNFPEEIEASPQKTKAEDLKNQNTQVEPKSPVRKFIYINPEGQCLSESKQPKHSLSKINVSPLNNLVETEKSEQIQQTEIFQQTLNKNSSQKSLKTEDQERSNSQKRSSENLEQEQDFQNKPVIASENTPKPFRVEIIKYNNIGIRQNVQLSANNTQTIQTPLTTAPILIKPTISEQSPIPQSSANFQPSSYQTPVTPTNTNYSNPQTYYQHDSPTQDTFPFPNPVSRNPNSRNSFETPAYNIDQNESTDTLQNLSTFLNEHVKNQSKLLDVQNNLQNNSINIFEMGQQMKKSPSVRTIQHQNALNDLPNDAQILKTNILSKDLEIKFLKEKMALLNESQRLSVQRTPVENLQQIQHFKVEQLGRNIKAAKNENEYLKKQFNTNRIELERIVNKSSQKMYDARINFDRETRALMELKEREIVMKNMKEDNEEVRNLAAKLQGYLNQNESKAMKGFLMSKK